MYLIIGASSLIGRHIAKYCKDTNKDFVGTYFSHKYDCTDFYFDLQNDNFSSLISKLPKNSIENLKMIICSANARIDYCYAHKEETYTLNVLATKSLINQAVKIGVKPIFLSSEAVFDGKKGLYTEEDKPFPINEYGRQKLEIENFLLNDVENALIFRISRAVGAKFGEIDIFSDFYNKIKHDEPINCLKDQSFSLTEVNDIANAIILSCEQDLQGLFHIAAPNYVTRYELAKIYAQRIFGGYEKIFEKEYAEIPFADGRHIHGGLIGDKLQKILNNSYKNLNEILTQYETSYKLNDS